MAVTEFYVDPSIDADSGSGTSGDPYGDLQYGFDQTTLGSEGTWCHLQDSATESMGATSLDFTTHGAPSNDQCVRIQGYSSTAKDGGFGVIDMGNGTAPFINGNQWVMLRNLDIKNVGAAALLLLGETCVILECKLHDADNYAVQLNGLSSRVEGCEIYDIGGTGIYALGDRACICGNYLYNDGGSRYFDYGIDVDINASGASVRRNIITLGAASTKSSNGIECSNGSPIEHNSILHDNGTGAGIKDGHSSSKRHKWVNNLIEGFNGSGGIGLKTGTNELAMVVANGVYNCSTSLDFGYSTDEIPAYFDNDLPLSGSPFAKSGSDTFANRFTYFAPSAEVQGDAYGGGGRLDRGAVQHADSGGGASVIIPRRRFFAGHTFEKASRAVISAGGAPTIKHVPIIKQRTRTIYQRERQVQRQLITQTVAGGTEYVPIPQYIRRLVIQQHYRRRPGTVIATTTPAGTEVVPIRSRARTLTQHTRGRTRAVIVPAVTEVPTIVPICQRRRHVVRQHYQVTRRATSHQHSPTVNQTVIVSSPRKVR